MKVSNPFGPGHKSLMQAAAPTQASHTMGLGGGDGLALTGNDGGRFCGKDNTYVFVRATVADPVTYTDPDDYNGVKGIPLNIACDEGLYYH